MPLSFAHESTRRWFERSFEGATRAQKLGWGPIAAGESTLLLAPTGSGKTLAAFLVAIDKLLFGAKKAGAEKTRAKATSTKDDKKSGVRVLYISPLKALAVDVERNLRAPLAGICAEAAREGTPTTPPTVGIRSGDTTPKERARMKRTPPDVLITTPESLFLLLTSQSAAGLASIETVIIDEIHSLVPTKRGAHLALSLERLEALRRRANPNIKPMQRIGLSATQRPLDEVARYLGGAESDVPRPVTIVDAGSQKEFDLRVEVPVEDMARMQREEAAASGDEDDLLQPGATSGQRSPSIWPAIHPRLVQLIRDHRSTMLFVNSRRLAERLAAAINELAGEELALAHHGSIAKDMRASIEDRLKKGELPAIVATSSLELGIDIGAVDLVIQIEAPLSVASGIQRIGRAGHQVGAVSEGIVFPKYRGDLLACAAVTEHILEGKVESTHYPRNALDVLAQQVVAIVSSSPFASEESIDEDALYALVRGAAPYAELARTSFHAVLDMLSGRYPSEQFAELRPRITWDRGRRKLSPRRGAKMLAIANAGTIPDRGLYGVFLANSEKSVRVGELDEEMVFESREGEVFLLGASSWRIEEITHEKVMVSPAPGQPGKMPFWHGDRPGRPAEFGRAIGKLARELLAADGSEARERLVTRHGLDARAAENLLQYLQDQKEATGQVPSDKRIVVERFRDEIGDLCVVILSPFGGRVHSPWATAVRARLLSEYGAEADVIHGDDGIVFRLIDADVTPPPEFFFPDPAEVEGLVMSHLGETALFAARFRENAGRALLLPRRRPGKRTPLWAQRRKSAGLLKVASSFRDFPIVLETYRECLRDVFDLPELTALLHAIKTRKVRVTHVDTKRPSPFAGALMFNYVAAFMYEGDAPLAERRAQALSLDQTQLRALLGEPEMRELLEADAVREVEAQLRRDAYPLTHADAVHDRLLSMGDRRADELPGEPKEIAALLRALADERRVVAVRIDGEERFIAIEDMARYRDALGIVPPPWTPTDLLMPAERPMEALVARYAQTHGPFRAESVATRYGLGVAPVNQALERLVAQGRMATGELLPTELLRERGLGGGREFCSSEVLSRIKRRSLAILRRAIEAVDPPLYARFLLRWQGVEPRAGHAMEGLIEALATLEGVPVPASDLETRILPARVGAFDRRDLDELFASGDLVWRGEQSLGDKDGRVAIYSADQFSLLASPPEEVEGELALQLLDLFADRGALFFRDMVAATGRLSSEVFDALWDLVWAGHVTNDTFAPLRARVGDTKAQARTMSRMRSRRPPLNGSLARSGPPGSAGRWSLLPKLESWTPTQRLEALASSLLQRYGVLTREGVSRCLGAHADVPGFGALYPVLKAMEEVGRVRRGYFIAGLGATQFALPGCEDRLRDERDTPEEERSERGSSRSHCLVLAADDPANPYGASLPWPTSDAAKALRPSRSAGARVVLVEGSLRGFIGRTGQRLSTFLPTSEPERSKAAHALAEALGRGTGQARGKRGGGAVVFKRIDGGPAAESDFVPYLLDAGFQPAAKSMHRRLGAASTRPN